jgi:hypothetical protein
VEESLPLVVASITKQAIKQDQQRLRAPKFLPQLETPFGSSSGDTQRKQQALVPSGYLGLSEVSVPIPSVDSSQDDDEVSTASTVRMRTRNESSSVSNKSGAPKSWRAIGGGTSPGEKWFSSDITPFEMPGSLEVHMRRYDTDSLLHRRALGAVRIEAPPALVWELLTTYENMPMFIPHLMHTEFIQRYSADILRKSETESTKRVRMRQVFLKCELFHAIEEATALDLVQKDEKGELQFRVLQNPKFGALQGKWLVVPTNEPNATVLKFAIEGVVRAPGSDVTTKKVDPLQERIAYEGISEMLKLARDFMGGIASKTVKSYGSVDIKIADLAMKGKTMSIDEMSTVMGEISSAGTQTSKSRDAVADELAALKSALVKLGFGTQRIMPSRDELRKDRHWDIIKRVEALGGFVVVANEFGWYSSKTRPRGYWTLRTLELEIADFIANSDDPLVYKNPQVMPSQKALRDGGRADIVNALKRFGGALKVAQSINFEVTEERLKAANRPNAHKK